MSSVIPTLPPTWPYSPRAPLVPLVSRISKISGREGTWELWAPEHLTLDDPAQPLSGAFGRGGVFRVGPVVVRPYRRGGLLGKINRARYGSSRRFSDEYAVHAALWEQGFPTVMPLGFAWRPCPVWGVEGLFFTAWAENSRGWANGWQDGEAVLTRVWGHMQALDTWGLWSPDLNATNVLIASDGEVCLLDWDRACWDSSRSHISRYRDRLRRSLVKRSAPSNLVTLLDSLS